MDSAGQRVCWWVGQKLGLVGHDRRKVVYLRRMLSSPCPSLLLKGSRSFQATLCVPLLGLLLAACDGTEVPRVTLGDGAAGDSGQDSGLPPWDGSLRDAGFGDGSNTCERVSVSSVPTAPPEVMIVLDKSTSMLAWPTGASEPLWGGATTAIDRLTRELEGSVAFGLTSFPDYDVALFDSDANRCRSGAIVSSFALNNSASILAEIRSAFVYGNTPTAATLENVRQHLRGTPPVSPESDRVVILVTDGAPNCGSPYEGTDSEEGAGLGVAALAADGVEVYVIGFSAAGHAEILDALAAFGGTGRTTHIPASNTAELEVALSDVTYGVLPCDYELSEVPEDLGFVKVLLDGEQINPVSVTPTRGWSIVDRTLELVGTACEQLRDGSMRRSLEITVECERVPVI